MDTVAARQGSGIAGRGTEEKVVGHQQTLTGHRLCAWYCPGHWAYSRGIDREVSCPRGGQTMTEPNLAS